MKLRYVESVTRLKSNEYLVSIGYRSAGLNAVDFKRQMEMIAESKATEICWPHSYDIQHEFSNFRIKQGLDGLFKFDSNRATVTCHDDTVTDLNEDES